LATKDVHEVRKPCFQKKVFTIKKETGKLFNGGGLGGLFGGGGGGVRTHQDSKRKRQNNKRLRHCGLGGEGLLKLGGERLF